MDKSTHIGRQRIIQLKSLIQRTPIHAHAPGSKPLSQDVVQKVQGKGPLTATDVMALQRTIGNQAVQRMLEEQEEPHVKAKNETVGRPLPSEVRAKMEQSFRTSFSNVQIHQGDQADAMDARAYAQGSDIHVQRSININGYEGQKVLAHELAHVVQQRSGRVTIPQGDAAINDNPHLETEAHRAANKAANGASAGIDGSRSTVQRTPAKVIQRWPKWMKKAGRGLKKGVSGKGKGKGGGKQSKSTKPDYRKYNDVNKYKQDDFNDMNGHLKNALGFGL